jgi:hypothetical protein
MKSRFFVFLVIVLVFSISACDLGTSQMAATPNIAETAKAIVSATSNAEKSMQTTISAAVAATNQASTTNQPALTQTPPTQVNYYTLSEEELSALIDQSVQEAMNASQTANTTTSQATSDGSVSTEEVQTVTVSTQEAELLLNEVDQMINAYYELYGAYASATLTELQAIEAELAGINSSLQSIEQIMEKGAQEATAAIEQLNKNITEIQTKVKDVQTKDKGWSDRVKGELDIREKDLGNIQANDVAKDRIGALESVKKYASSLKEALSDKKIMPDELKNIAQLGANATTSLKKSGGPQLADLSEQINRLTTLTARGDIPQVQKGMPDFERSIQKRR